MHYAQGALSSIRINDRQAMAGKSLIKTKEYQRKCYNFIATISEDNVEKKLT